MVKNFLCYLFVCICQFTLTAEAQVIEEIKTAGQIYAYAQIQGDYEILLDFTYPKLIERAGGRTAMKNILKQIQDTKINKGQKLTALEFGDDIQFTTNATEVHAVVPFITVTKVPGGTITSESTLIAVGTESRDNWYFIETTSINEENISKVLPSWDHSLELPYKKPPVYKEDPL
ncbi:hypothetical protein [Cyclobacterium qasimii]|uniref:Nuclear transport factor 2 family protein n=2 Tax=Cyclobacterium qasimii TaxID=1350429 RepID=S7VHA2_9BACT|nr:hypothetical protein [Cyclobacterium qasimii]EPR69356.1 hypothetical protein ADICYQ_1601 [Cyclobacterium qasimii M12-11B]GEO22844.1 hypothetical protein CQA01_33780 [Cyclobacterium qasimii]